MATLAIRVLPEERKTAVGGSQGPRRDHPTMGIRKIDPGLISRDHTVVWAYREDPLVHHGKLPARTVAELPPRSNTSPLSCRHCACHCWSWPTPGTASSPTGSRMVHDRAGSPDRTLHPLPRAVQRTQTPYHTRRRGRMARCTHQLEARHKNLLDDFLGERPNRSTSGCSAIAPPAGNRRLDTKPVVLM